MEKSPLHAHVGTYVSENEGMVVQPGKHAAVVACLSCVS